MQARNRRMECMIPALEIAASLALLSVSLACAPDEAALVTRRDPAGASTPGPSRIVLKERTVLPFGAADLPHIRGNLPGIGEVNLLVDTGAAFSWIDDEFARRAGMTREPLGVTLTDIMGKESEIAERTYLSRLELGSLTVHDLRPPLLRSLDPEVHGSIGQDILRTMTVVIDGPGRRLILTPETDVEAALEEFFSSGGTNLSYEVDWTRGIPVVDVPIGDLEGHYPFTIDTGSAAMTVSRALALAADLELVGTVPAIGLSFAGGDTNEYAVRDLMLQNLTVTGDAVEAPHCSLGWGVLRHVVLFFPRNQSELLLFTDPVRR